MVTKVITLFFAAGAVGVVVAVGAVVLAGLLQAAKINIPTNTVDNSLNKCAPQDCQRSSILPSPAIKTALVKPRKMPCSTTPGVLLIR